MTSDGFVGEWHYQPLGPDPYMYADLPAVAVEWVRRTDGWYSRIKTAKPQMVKPIPADD